MLISAETSRELAQIVLAAAQDDASAEGPLSVRDRGDTWLVTGPSLVTSTEAVVRRTFYIFFRKVDAEVTGIGYCFDFAQDEAVEAAWKQHASPSAFAAWQQRPEVRPSNATVDLYETLHGGLINRPDDATAYARALSRSSDIGRTSLSATEQEGVWTISSSNKKVLSFSRRAGKIVFSLL